MDLIGIIVVLVVVGVLLYLINNYVPLDPKIRKILNVAVVVFVLLWLIISFMNATGVSLNTPRID
jgi:1-acyl-sn-glycerol-3-phosphate acyltransferase